MGHYSYTANALATTVDSGPLHALASGSSGGNGVFAYGASRFPTRSYNATNYWVDVVFSTQDHGPYPNPPQGKPTGAAPATPWVNISPHQVSTSFNHPVSNYGFLAIAIDPSHPKTIYVGTCYQGLWKTTTGGKTWFKVNMGTNGKLLDTGRIWSIAIDPFHPQTLYVADGYGFEQGVWKSTDGGASWGQMLPTTSTVAQRTSIDVGDIAIDPYRPGHLLLAFHSGWHAGKSIAGILESIDGGTSWIIHQPRPSWGDSHAVFFLNNSSTWLFSDADGFWRTTNSGTTWTKVARSVGIGGSGGGGIYRAKNGVWYVGSASNLLRSADNGMTWTAVGPGGTGYFAVIGDGHSLYTQPAYPALHVSGPNYYIYSPETDGVAWSPYNQQTFADGPIGMAYDSINHIVYSVNSNAGVWMLQTPNRPSAPRAR
jgi:hypothetical protein